MATCQVEIRAIIDAGDIDTVTVLTPNTDFALNIGFGVNQLFLVNTIAFNTATFLINLVADPPPASVRSHRNVFPVHRSH